MNTEQTMIKMTFDRWHALMTQCNDLLAALTDDDLLREISPGRNRGIYILGHLTAVHDHMLPLLDFGDKLYPELAELFVSSPDKAHQLPTAADMRAKWANLNDVLNEGFFNMTSPDWFKKHTAVSDEDFAKEPHRNKLNIMVTRTTHLAYHLGQMILLK